jgi:penicillin-binding protein 1A
MGYPGRKKNLGNDMTGGRGALPIFIDFMKFFLKDKPKETFDKAPSMPEDMKELQKQRQREMAEERSELYAMRSGASKGGDKNDDNSLPTAITTPKLEQVTLPPAPSSDGPSGGPPAPATDALPKKTEAGPSRSDSPPPPAATRPREVEPAKKKGKKGNDEP